MLQELLTRRATLPQIGKGAFGKVYGVRTAVVAPISFSLDAMPSGMIDQRVEDRVLKVAVPDGSADWIEWCYLRMKRFGEDSIEMDGLPRVYEFARFKAFEEERFHNRAIYPGDELWACLMERYDYTATDWRDRDRKNPRHDEFARKMEERFAPIFGQWFFDDMRGGNVMWSIKRNGFILTDPSCSDRTGCTPQSQPSYGTAVEYSRVAAERPEDFEELDATANSAGLSVAVLVACRTSPSPPLRRHGQGSYREARQVFRGRSRVGWEEGGPH